MVAHRIRQGRQTSWRWSQFRNTVDVLPNMRKELASLWIRTSVRSGCCRMGGVVKVTRPPGDYRLYEEEIRPLIPLENNLSQWYQYCCPHWIQPSGKYEIGYVRLTEPHPLLGEQTRRIAMCCDCYQILRKAEVAPLPGTWEDKK